MKADLERFMAWIGVFVGAGGYTASLLGMLDDPLYVLSALLLGVCLAGWNHYSAETELVTSTGFGGATNHARSSKDRLRSKHLFWGSLAVFALAVLCDGLSFIRLADVTAEIQFVQRHAPGPNDDPQLPVARGSQNSVEFDTDESQNLTVIKRSRIPWLQIEDVELVVDKFERQPRPESAPAPAGMIKPPLVYVAHIDQTVLSERGGQRVFPAKVVDIESTMGDAPYRLMKFDPVVLIEDGKPQRLLVKVNCGVNSIVTYHLRIRFRYLWQTQTWNSQPRTLKFVCFDEPPDGAQGPSFVAPYLTPPPAAPLQSEAAPVPPPPPP